MNLAPRIADLRPTAVNQVLREVRELQREGRDLVSLMRGQPDSPTAPHIVEAAGKALREGRTGYPDNLGEPGLRQAVAAKLQRQHGVAFDPAREILITDGATGGLFTALGVLIEPGDEVLLPDPVYDAYSSPIALWGGRPVPVPSTIRGGRFTFDGANLRRSCTPRARAVLLNSPWNPVGTVLTRNELQEIAAFAAEQNLFILSDEIYESLVYDGRCHVSPVQLGDEIRQRTVLINSLSKTYAMTGWRVGYCAAPAAIIQAMLLLWQQFSRGPATFVQDAAAGALNADQGCVQRMTAEYQQRRNVVLERLHGIDGVVPLVPEGGLFVMVDVRGLGMSSDQVRRVLLQEFGVVVIHGAAYGPSGEGTLRVSFAAGGATLERGLDRLRTALAALAARKES